MKVEYYQLLILNVGLIIATFCKELPYVYILGSFVFIFLGVSFLGYTVMQVCQKRPDEEIIIVGTETQRNYESMMKMMTEFLKEAGESMIGKEKYNSIILVLCFWSIDALRIVFECVHSSWLLGAPSMYCFLHVDVNLMFGWLFLNEEFQCLCKKVGSLICCRGCWMIKSKTWHKYPLELNLTIRKTLQDSLHPVYIILLQIHL